MVDFQQAAFWSMLRAYNPGCSPNGYATGLLQQSDVDLTRSLCTYYDAPRTCAYATRSQGSTLLSEPFDSLAAWSQVKTGSAKLAIANPGDPDPMTGNVLDMTTGGTLTSVAGAQKTLSSIPSTFGLFLLCSLVAVGPNQADALNVAVQTSAGDAIRLRFNDSAVYVNLSGTWQLLFAHGGNYYTEWWVECAKVGSNYTVSLYAGTQKLTTLTGTPSTGTPGYNNTIVITQQSGATANRHSQVAACNLGTTQLSDHMVMCSPVIASPAAPTQATIAILVEDVSVDLAPNVNFFASITDDNTATWTPVALTDYGSYGMGEVDNQKALRLIAGTVTLPPNGQSMRYVIETIGGFYVVQAITLFWS